MTFLFIFIVSHSRYFHIFRQSRSRPGNSAILLETGSCAIILTRGDSQSRDASRALRRLLNMMSISTEIAQ